MLCGKAFENGDLDSAAGMPSVAGLIMNTDACAHTHFDLNCRRRGLVQTASQPTPDLDTATAPQQGYSGAMVDDFISCMSVRLRTDQK